MSASFGESHNLESPGGAEVNTLKKRKQKNAKFQMKSITTHNYEKILGNWRGKLSTISSYESIKDSEQPSGLL